MRVLKSYFFGGGPVTANVTPLNQMRWDDRIFTGTRGKWTWIVVREMIRALPELTGQFHLDQHLCITAFDSGPIKPSDDERAIGWRLVEDVMVSPRVTGDLVIPCDTHDEWYLFRTLPDSFGITERYVNYGTFNLADPRELARSQDPTWDRTSYDWLIPLQERFWDNLERLNPCSCVASGDADIVVTTNEVFAERILEAARQAVG